MDMTAEHLAAFLTGYAELLEQMRGEGMEMLAAVASGELAGIERELNAGQANQMRLEQFEQQRRALQADAGNADATLSQMVAMLPAAERGPLEALLSRVEEAARQLRNVNEKGLAATQSTLTALDAEEAAPPASHSPQPARQEGDDTPSLNIKT